MRVYLPVSVAVLASAFAVQPQDKPSGPMPCVEVQIGKDSTSHMNCINEALKRAVEREHNAPMPQAPISAQSASKRRRGPRRVISSAAASLALPTSRLASRRETSSIAPDTPMPSAAKPRRPPSCKLVCQPGARTEMLIAQ